MMHKIWFNIERLYYSLKGLDYKGKVMLEGNPDYKVGEFIEISGVAFAGYPNGTYKIRSVR